MVGVILFSFVSLVSAQTQSDYTVLAPLPGVGATTNITSYIPAAFNLAIGVSAVLAFVMITFGGIMYATSDAITGKSQGREYATNAIYGLLLVLGAYAILNTINPQILSFNLDIPVPQNVPATTPTVTGPTPAGSTYTYTGRIMNGYVMTQAQIEDDRANRSALVGVSVNNPPCLIGNTSGCTNMNNLSQSVILGLNGLAAQGACGCAITVTGGTEGGHEDHRPGLQIVDIRPSAELNRYLGAPANPPDGARATATLPNGRRLLMVYERAGGNPSGTSTGDHWHTTIE